jgi:poly-gamma-glutamate synthesis protein (capsule biosynthesis protein)
MGLISSLSGDVVASGLREAGFDLLNLAANHVLDAGSIGLEYTRACLENAGIVTAGVGWSQDEARELKVVSCGGLDVGFLCYGEDSNYTLGHTAPGYAYYERDTVLEDVARHRDRVDVLVVSVHADIEFMPTPSLPRYRIFREIADAGATVVLGHHPHVPQGIEMRGTSLIAYSLGNFLFQAHTSAYMKSNGPHTADSFVLLVDLAREGVTGFRRIPCAIAEPPEQRPAELRAGNAERMLARFEELDSMLADEYLVRDTWRAVCKRMLATYIKRLAGMDVDDVIREMAGRLALTAENRSWMQEILEWGREYWDAMHQEDIPYRRPSDRFVRR